MKVLNSELYNKQLQELLKELIVDGDITMAKSFKLYLDTIMINMPTKARKYKKSIYFDDENIKDIEHQGLTIPFYQDTALQTYVLLGIYKNFKQQ